jgi:hypothetical protein
MFYEPDSHENGCLGRPIEDKPGGLAKLLGALAGAGANLECVVARPARGEGASARWGKLGACRKIIFTFLTSL